MLVQSAVRLLPFTWLERSLFKDDCDFMAQKLGLQRMCYQCSSFPSHCFPGKPLRKGWMNEFAEETWSWCRRNCWLIPWHHCLRWSWKQVINTTKLCVCLYMRLLTSGLIVGVHLRRNWAKEVSWFRWVTEATILLKACSVLQLQVGFCIGVAKTVLDTCQTPEECALYLQDWLWTIPGKSKYILNQALFVSSNLGTALVEVIAGIFAERRSKSRLSL